MDIATIQVQLLQASFQPGVFGQRTQIRHIGRKHKADNLPPGAQQRISCEAGTVGYDLGLSTQNICQSRIQQPGATVQSGDLKIRIPTVRNILHSIESFIYIFLRDVHAFGKVGTEDKLSLLQSASPLLFGIE